MNFLYCSLIGYMIGTFNPSYLIAKFKGFDIRKNGSGNAGASNALILLGKTFGIFCAVIDIVKAYTAIYICESLFNDFEFAFAVTGVCCIIGHIFPFYMNFKGGKGLACLGGMILYFDYKVFLIMLTFEIIIALLSDYICIVPISASAVFPIVYGVITGSIIGSLILFVSHIIIFYKHFENLYRIYLGVEMHISYLWNPTKELNRLKNNSENLLVNKFTSYKNK